MRAAKTLRKITTTLREIPGGVYAGEYLRSRYGGRRHVIEITDFDGDLTMFLDLGEHMQSQIFWLGSYSRNILFLIKRLLRPSMVFVDGGANVGEISLVAGKLVGSQGRVFSFEPMKRFADQLERNRAANGLECIEIHRTGLSDKRGMATIYLAPEHYRDGTQHDGLGTLFRSNSRNDPAAAVELVTLDEFLSERNVPHVDMIKLDVEGGELPALIGAQHTLKRSSPAIIVEIGEETCIAAGYRMGDILSFLQSYGYQFHRIERKGRLQRIEASDLRKFQNVYCVRQ